MAEVLCPAGPLEKFIHQVCLAVGTDEVAAAEVAHHLVRANLSGHDSHGVLRMSWYVEQVQAARMDVGDIAGEFGAALKRSYKSSAA